MLDSVAGGSPNNLSTLNDLNKITFELFKCYKIWYAPYIRSEHSILATCTRLSVTYFKKFNFKICYELSRYPT
jgi:hypothetical protein